MNRSLISLSIAVIFLLLAGGLYTFAYLRLESDTTRAATLNQQVTIKSAQLEQVVRSRATLAGLPAEETNIEQYFVGKQEIVPFLEALQATGKPLGVTVQVLSVSDSIDGKHPRLALSLTITGSFDGVMRTLGAIENGPYDGVLTNVTVDSVVSTDPKVANKIWTASAILSLGTQTASAVATTTKP